MQRALGSASTDNELTTFRPLSQPPIVYAHPHADLSLLPNALGRPKAEFLPVLNPHALRVAETYIRMDISRSVAAQRL